MGRQNTNLLMATVLAFLLTAIENAVSIAQETSKEAPTISTYTNENPQFVLKLSERYKQIESTNDSILTFTLTANPDTIVGIYDLHHPLKRETRQDAGSKLPNTQESKASWKELPVTVVQQDKVDSKGLKTFVRFVEIPLKRDAISIMVVSNHEDETLADRAIQDMLAGLDGEPEWVIPKPKTAAERMSNAVLGTGMALALLILPFIGFRRLLRSRNNKNPLAITASDQSQKMKSPTYWVKIILVSFAVIAAVLGYISLLAFSISLVLDRDFGNTFLGTFAAIELAVIVAQLVTLASWFLFERTQSQDIANFAPNPLRKMNLAVGILSLVAAAVCGMSLITMQNSPSWFMVLLAPLQVMVGLQFLTRGLSPIRISENSQHVKSAATSDQQFPNRAMVGMILFLSILYSGVAQGERVQEKRDQADYIVLGQVTAVYLRESDANREYIVEIKVEDVERGPNLKNGEIFRAYCYRSKETRAIPHASGHSKVPSEGNQVKVFVNRAAGRNTGVYKNWIDILESTPN